MRGYWGDDDDKIVGGGKHIDETGSGGEVFNFLDHYDGYVYGYVQPPGESISIERIGESQYEDRIEDVLVIWSATDKDKGGRFIIGWYHNPTVYRSMQSIQNADDRKYRGTIHKDFFAKVRKEDCLFLPVTERRHKIPHGSGMMFRSNIWYADKKKGAMFRKSVIDYIKNFEKSTKGKELKETARAPRQMDPQKRALVEKNAIEITTKYFRDKGYNVTSYEKDNVGWDLEAINQEEQLLLEVKGLSGNTVRVELTPNEYKNAREYFFDYRICIVTNAIGENPILRIFSSKSEEGPWQDKDGMLLDIDEKVAAILTGMLPEQIE